MNRNEIQEALAQMSASLHHQFEDKVGTHDSRLAQLDSAIANVAMTSDCLFDEEAREVDLAIRYMDDAATSPVAGRGKKHYAEVARRAK